MSVSAAPLLSFDHRTLRPRNTALFLDFDGTLAEIVDDPDAVSVHPEMRSLLGRLDASTAGALAIVTGRAIRDIDRFLTPLKLPVAGVHGLERRTAAGDLISASLDGRALEAVRERLGRIAHEMRGTSIEEKPGSLAFHFRKVPDLADTAVRAVHEAVDGLDGVDILHGKMVVEVKTGKATKADAVAAFMGEAPFRGRFPLFAGDDETDEHAFAEIERRDGASIKIGQGKTTARYRAEGTDELRAWLSGLADGFDTTQSAG